MSYSKAYLATFKGKKVTFKIVNSSPDLKVKFVDYSADYRVRIADRRLPGSEIIKIQIVEYSPDVKLQKVKYSGDFEAYIE